MHKLEYGYVLSNNCNYTIDQVDRNHLSLQQLEEMEKQSTLLENIPPVVYDKLMQNEVQLTNYLKYIRYKQPPRKVLINTNFLKQNSALKEPLQAKEKKQTAEIRVYVEAYVRLVREVNNIQNYVGKKIIRKVISYLDEFPSMSYLVEVFNSFGKEKKKLCLNQGALLVHAVDQMVPLFQKIIEKIQLLKKEAESKKLMELGHRIEHLQFMINGAKNHVLNSQSSQIFKTFQSDRIEKYILMEENINKAEKNYGKFSQNFHKNKEVFSNINKVYMQINKVNRVE